MKTLNLKKTLLATFVFCAMFIANLSAGNEIINSNEESCKNEEVIVADAKITPDCAVSDAQVCTYLYANGYSRVRVLYWTAECTAICDTSNPYNTAVYTSGTSIIGHTDTPTKK